MQIAVIRAYLHLLQHRSMILQQQYKRLMGVKGGVVDESHIIRYTTISGNVFTPNMSNSDNELVSNTYENGEGVMVFANPVTTISSYMFQNSYDLMTLHLPEGLYEIGSNAFFFGGVPYLEIPSTVGYIEGYAFENIICSTIVFRSTTPPIFGGAFMSSELLPPMIYVPKGCVEVYRTEYELVQYANYIYENPDDWIPVNEVHYTTSDGAIANVTWNDENSPTMSIVSNTYENGKGVIRFNEPILRIPPNGLSCETLTSVTLPPSVYELQTNAFYGSYELTDIELRAHIISIYENAFYGVEAAFEVESIIPASVSYSSSWQGLGYATSITVPADAVEAYRTADGWSEYADIIVAKKGKFPPNNQVWYTTTNGNILSHTFMDLRAMQHTNANLSTNEWDGTSGVLTYDADVTSLTSNIWQNTNALTMSFPDSLTTINTQVFYGCRKITELWFGTGLSNIYNNAFRSALAVLYFRGTTPPTLQGTPFAAFTQTIYVPVGCAAAYIAKGFPSGQVQEFDFESL